jgi:hypothetical protein
MVVVHAASHSQQVVAVVRRAGQPQAARMEPAGAVGCWIWGEEGRRWRLWAWQRMGRWCMGRWCMGGCCRAVAAGSLPLGAAAPCVACMHPQLLLLLLLLLHQRMGQQGCVEARRTAAGIWGGAW